jgi:G:T-mismatch repair DNA endonuclease (very short patch repair protein)
MPALTNEECHELARTKEGLFLEDKTTGRRNIWLHCNRCNEDFEMERRRLKDPSRWHPACGKARAAEKQLNQDGLRLAQEYARSRGGECLSETYPGTGAMPEHRYSDDRHPIYATMRWKCPCIPNIWEATYHNIVNGKTWCDKCCGRGKEHGDYIANARKIAKEREGQLHSIKCNERSDKLDFTCKKGHNFTTTYDSIRRYSWCPTCAKRSYSIASLCWLDPDETGLQTAVHNDGEYKISGMRVDGYDPETDTVYEFHGCFFHGCLTCYPDRRTFGYGEKPMSEVYEKTIKKDQKIRDLGYTLVTMWECEFKELYKDCKKDLQELRRHYISLCDDKK